MTQSELAERSGVDKAIISKIEAGKMLGTIECHKKLAGVFGLRLSQFYAFLESGKTESVEFHPGASKTDVYQDFLEILTSIPLSKKMLPTIISINPGEEKHLEETTKKTERFIIILEGEAKIEIAGSTYNLKKEADWEKGDSIYSISQQQHKIKNTGNIKAKLLCISSPPVL